MRTSAAAKSLLLFALVAAVSGQKCYCKQWERATRDKTGKIVKVPERAQLTLYARKTWSTVKQFFEQRIIDYNQLILPSSAPEGHSATEAEIAEWADRKTRYAKVVELDSFQSEITVQAPTGVGEHGNKEFRKLTWRWILAFVHADTVTKPDILAVDLTHIRALNRGSKKASEAVSTNFRFDNDRVVNLKSTLTPLAHQRLAAIVNLPIKGRPEGKVLQGSYEQWADAWDLWYKGGMKGEVQDKKNYPQKYFTPSNIPTNFQRSAHTFSYTSGEKLEFDICRMVAIWINTYLRSSPPLSKSLKTYQNYLDLLSFPDQSKKCVTVVPRYMVSLWVGTVVAKALPKKPPTQKIVSKKDPKIGGNVKPPVKKEEPKKGPTKTPVITKDPIPKNLPQKKQDPPKTQQKDLPKINILPALDVTSPEKERENDSPINLNLGGGGTQIEGEGGDDESDEEDDEEEEIEYDLEDPTNTIESFDVKPKIPDTTKVKALLKKVILSALQPKDEPEGSQKKQEPPTKKDDKQSPKKQEELPQKGDDQIDIGTFDVDLSLSGSPKVHVLVEEQKRIELKNPDFNIVMLENKEPELPKNTVIDHSLEIIVQGATNKQIEDKKPPEQLDPLNVDQGDVDFAAYLASTEPGNPVEPLEALNRYMILFLNGVVHTETKTKKILFEVEWPDRIPETVTNLPSFLATPALSGMMTEQQHQTYQNYIVFRSIRTVWNAHVTRTTSAECKKKMCKENTRPWLEFKLIIYDDFTLSGSSLEKLRKLIIHVVTFFDYNTVQVSKIFTRFFNFLDVNRIAGQSRNFFDAAMKNSFVAQKKDIVNLVYLGEVETHIALQTLNANTILMKNVVMTNPFGATKGEICDLLRIIGKDFVKALPELHKKNLMWLDQLQNNCPDTSQDLAPFGSKWIKTANRILI